jgi:hypothetical protein
VVIVWCDDDFRTTIYSKEMRATLVHNILQLFCFVVVVGTGMVVVRNCVVIYRRERECVPCDFLL